MTPDDVFRAIANSKRYRNLQFLGRGAGSVVWSADCKVAGKVVALKAITDLDTGSARQRSLQRELALSHHLDHPNILRIHRFDPGGAHPPLIEMEYAPGGNLGDLAERSGGCLTWASLKPLALQLCDALAHAHGASVVHRDIKPSNLLLAKDGSLKLADFGCAALIETAWNETTSLKATSYQGTLPYMSPQQLNGLSPHPSDDIYAVGATLHTLLVGSPPFYRGYIVNQILSNSPPSIEVHLREIDLVNDVPKSVQATILRCMAKKREDRPSSAEVLKCALDSDSVIRMSRRRIMISVIAGGALAGLGVIGSRQHESAFVEKGKSKRKVTEHDFPGADRNVLSVASLPDGGILLGGQFTRFFGEPCGGIVRLNSEGEIDLDFNPVVFGVFRALLVLSDSRVLVGGDLWDESRTRRHLMLLDSNGRQIPNVGLECDSTVLCMSMDIEGRILVGGIFNRVGKTKRRRLARFTPNMDLDFSFSPEFDGNVHAVVPHDDGSIFVGGQFTEINDRKVAYFAKLHPDGSLAAPWPRIDGEVSCMAVCPDHSMVLGGRFQSIDGDPIPQIIKLAMDGSIDHSFSPMLSGAVLSIVARADGALLIGGEFSDRAEDSLAPEDRCRDRVALITSDGQFERNFRFAADEPVQALAYGFGNDLILGGGFSRIAGKLAYGFFRQSITKEDDSLRFQGESRLIWSRSPQSEYLTHVTFEISTNEGKTWELAGAGIPCKEGWEVELRRMSGKFIVRARGRTTGGIHNGSSGISQIREMFDQ